MPQNMQYVDGRMELSYENIKCDKMYHFETKYGINQTLSPEHRVIYYERKKAKGKKYWSDNLCLWSSFLRN